MNMIIPGKDIWLHKHTEIIDIQSVFCSIYPYLKIDFLKSDASGLKQKNIIIDPLTPLKGLFNFGSTHKLDISKERSVSDISDDLEHILGVIIQVSRKSGNVWNTISETDNWSLDTQNAAGKFVSAQMQQQVVEQSIY
jgi:hypothetical protein